MMIAAWICGVLAVMALADSIIDYVLTLRRISDGEHADAALQAAALFAIAAAVFATGARL